MAVAGLSVNEPVRHSWRTFGLGLGLAVAWLCCAQSAGLAQAVWAVRDLAAGPTPWFVAPNALLLYVQVPAAAIAGSLLLFGPGLLIALRLDGGRGNFGAWLLRGFALTLVGLSVALGVFEALFHATLTGSAFATFLAGLCAAALVPV